MNASGSTDREARRATAPSRRNARGGLGFNPASNDRQRSTLRLTNTLDRAVEIVIEGVDDQGMAGPAGAVRLTLGAGEARTLTARQLEDGGDGLRGSLGDGAGKWRLSVSAPAGVTVMSLLESPTGHLANLSGGAYAAPPRRNSTDRADADRDGVADGGRRVSARPLAPAAGQRHFHHAGRPGRRRVASRGQRARRPVRLADHRLSLGS